MIFLSFLLAIFWPVSFFLNNGIGRWWLPSIIIAINFELVYWLLPLINPLLLSIPFLMTAMNFNRTKKYWPIWLTLAVIEIAVFGSMFWRQSIFVTNGLEVSLLNTKIGLNNLGFWGKLFYNRFTPATEKFWFNFFALIDPNNYFFAFHPREIVGQNQNLVKFGFAAMPGFVYGLINFKKIDREKWSQWRKTVLALVVGLSLLANFDKHDLILWWPITWMTVFGYRSLKKDVGRWWIGIFWVVMTLLVWELMRILV